MNMWVEKSFEFQLQILNIFIFSAFISLYKIPETF